MGIITDLIRNNIDCTYCYICYVEDIKRHILIETRKDFDLEPGTGVDVKGTLSLFILEKYN